MSPTGADSNPGTFERPFRTIQRAADVVVAGNTVTVRDGVYTDTGADGCPYPTVVCLKRPGTAAAPITFRAENRWGAVVDGQNSVPDGFNWAAGASYNVVDGFTVQGLRTSGGSVSAFELFNGGLGSKILNNNIRDIGRSTTNTSNGQVGVFTDQDGVTIQGNYFHEIGRLNDDMQHDHGIYLNDGDNVAVRDNYFEDIDRGWGLQVYPGGSANVTVSGNKFVGGFSNRGYMHVILGANFTGQMNNNVFWAASPSQTMTDFRGIFTVSFNNNATTGAAWSDRGGLPLGFVGLGNVLSAQIPRPPPPR